MERLRLTLEAQYIGGYSVECSLKALVLENTPEADRSDVPRRLALLKRALNLFPGHGRSVAIERDAEQIESMAKQFKLAAGQIQRLIPIMGACIASDRITVDGARVGYMYREESDFPADSGWRFLAGDETDEYLDNADNLGLYDVNTIANYDREIIPLLESPIGARFIRNPATGKLEADREPV